ncbi:MAG: hypothetical protein KAT05_01190 [Spirochaetes bacterium]|nr:hypothetical protein [Spirochaetota bacterium]
MKRFCNLFRNHLFCLTLLSFLLAVGVSILFYFIIELNINENASYYTLSSIFQGLFSILALAGIFVIFRIEQLSKDEAKYETDFKDHLGKIKNKTIPDLSSIGVMGISTKYIMGWNEHNAILKHLDERNFIKYLEELNKLKRKFKDENTQFEEKLGELKRGIEENERTTSFLTVNSTSIEALDNSKQTMINSLKICHNHVLECEKKGKLIPKNREIKSKLLELFKIPFISGMILIAFTIFFLPMINSNSKLGIQIPGNFVIGFFVSLTIMVIFEIIILIYYSMWGNEAKSTLI